MSGSSGIGGGKGTPVHRKTPRSAFLPILLLIVGVVVCVGLVLAFVPLMECESCAGVVTLSLEEWNSLNPTMLVIGKYGPAYACDWCERTGTTSLLRKVFQEPPEDNDLRRYFEVNVLRTFVKARLSTP